MLEEVGEKNIDVAIAMTFFNESPQNFRIAVKSIFAQTLTNWKLFLVSDGANAELNDLASKIQDPRVKVRIESSNMGLANRLNEIIREATSNYIIRMDADDVMVQDRLAIQVAFMRTNPNIDVLGTKAFLIDERDELQGEFREPKLPLKIQDCLQNGILSHPTVCFKRQWALMNPYNPKWRFTEDKELWLRTFESSSFAKITDRTLYYRVSSSPKFLKILRTTFYNLKLILFYSRHPNIRFFAYMKAIRLLVNFIVISIAVLTKNYRIVYSRKFHKTSQTFSDEKRSLEQVKNTIVPGWD